MGHHRPHVAAHEDRGTGLRNETFNRLAEVPSKSWMHLQSCSITDVLGNDSTGTDTIARIFCVPRSVSDDGKNFESSWYGSSDWYRDHSDWSCECRFASSQLNKRKYNHEDLAGAAANQNDMIVTYVSRSSNLHMLVAQALSDNVRHYISFHSIEAQREARSDRILSSSRWITDIFANPKGWSYSWLCARWTVNIQNVLTVCVCE